MGRDYPSKCRLGNLLSVCVCVLVATHLGLRYKSNNAVCSADRNSGPDLQPIEGGQYERDEDQHKREAVLEAL